MDPITGFDKKSRIGEKWISVQSELVGLDETKKEIKIEIMEDGKPRALAFFDIDGTLAHLGAIHSNVIAELFSDQEPVELEATYYRGFRLGTSFRELDRMREIYINGHTEWKDPEMYFKDRYIPHKEEIDEAGNSAHDIAAAMLKEYGKIAARICEELYTKTPEEFEKSGIVPIFLLAKMYARTGIPMVGFTANAKILVDKLVKYLKLSDLFLDIATDETMDGGGKEIAIHKLIANMEAKGIPVPKDRLVFVGDSLRGDIGTSLIAMSEDKEISGQGILVLDDRNALFEIEKQINSDPKLRHIADSIPVHGLVVADVPLDEKGNPMLLSRFREQFLRRL